MDIGINLVESYLRLAGYLTLTEFEVQGRKDDGTYDTITDVDVVAVRFPGNVYVGDPHDPECGMLLIDDPELRLEEDCVDVIIGEVKQGEAAINPKLLDHRTLHAVLQRIAWLYAEDLEEVVAGLQKDGFHTSPSRGHGVVRTRIVAFGRAPESNLNTITHTHVITTLLSFFDQFEDAFRPLQFKDPAPAFLRLLTKIGFEVSKPESADDPPSR